MTAPASKYDPRRPPSHWTRTKAPPKAEGWTYGGFYVVSRIGAETDPTKKASLYWWVHIEKPNGRMPNDADCRRVLKAFGMEFAEEAGPGRGEALRARHFMRPILED